MINLKITEKACNSNGVTLNEFLVMCIITRKVNVEKTIDSLISKGIVSKCKLDYFGNPTPFLLTKGNEIIDSCIADSEDNPDNIEELAKELKSIYPKGKKPGTNYYWADGASLIIKRLKLFFKKYGNKYTNEQIINATKKYVTSFNGDYQYMKLLKYFIFKDSVNAGEVEQTSELLTYIDNEDEVIDNNNWIDDLR